MKETFFNSIQSLLNKRSNAKFLVSLSGGVDSFVVLHLLKSFSDTVTSLDLMAIHVNHNLDLEDDQWDDFCTRQCKSTGIPLIRENVFIDGRKMIDGSARKERYRVIGKHTTIDSLVVTGHHANDNAESILMSLQRGTGLDGLTGIKQLRPLHSGAGELFRPMLAFTKSMIRQYAAENGVEWIEDPSNAKSDYVRNKIRNNVLDTLIMEQGDGVIRRISETGETCSSASIVLNYFISESLKNNEMWDESTPHILPVSALINTDIASFVYRHWLKLNGFIYMPSKNFTENSIGQLFDNYKKNHHPVVFIGKNKVIKREHNNIILTDR